VPLSCRVRGGGGESGEKASPLVQALVTQRGGSVVLENLQNAQLIASPLLWRAAGEDDGRHVGEIWVRAGSCCG
jgi:hypothetical protein